ncbi:hypothetical protein ABB29_07080 [Pseudoxanthomonas dokdonensis]|uniref:Uncharacterized protein n=2 Tax=Pseudoxanthomonas dokdonensis TaxID=344882 RepID=A0A0R0CV03_9GAMM|nr:hypothetical protein [Pseudoxanthomonas dokdonensis]KRG70186.1 hypothetical protein ABB29_07080 [Pseudoxanthomonas dokdonensis]
MAGWSLSASAAQAAAEPQPEIQRPVGKAQSVGQVHTIRQIPEACVRLEGAFTGQASQPYRYHVTRTSEQCQPRARLVDYAKARPSEASGWKLNDVIRIPSAACPSQQAVVRVWRMPEASNAPAPDGQGQTRVYLEDAKKDIASGKVANARIPLYAAGMKLEGDACP